MPLKIIGSGYGRTGTMALKIALETLGCGPCYHMLEVSKNPGHDKLWREATDRGTADWDTIFANYQACVDWPACSFWEALLNQYPDAKMILSIRDPEDWYQSVKNTIYQRMKMPRESENEEAHRDMAYHLILELTFNRSFADKKYAIDIFNHHIAEIKRKVPDDKLLVYETGTGWGPLCRFLQLPIPNQSYPHVNTTREFREQFRLHD